MTQPGNLQCKNVIHVVGQTDADKIKSTVKKVLQMCITHSHSSISFPAIGTGELCLLSAGKYTVCIINFVSRLLYELKTVLSLSFSTTH